MNTLMPLSYHVFAEIPKDSAEIGRTFAFPGEARAAFADIMETLRKYIISCETQSEGLLQRTQVRLRSPLRTGFFGSDAFSQVSCALVTLCIIGFNQRFYNERQNRTDMFPEKAGNVRDRTKEAVCMDKKTRILALALAALDVAGAPAQARKLPKVGDSVLILGANGKSGVLCGWEALKKVGPNGKVVGVVRNPKQVPALIELGVYTDVIVADCTKPVEVLEKALEANGGKEYDISISCVNIESCEMSAILPVRDDGLVYFFSMATSFTKAALGAEGVGKDVTMIVGNGYTKNHAEITLNVLRENEKLRKLFDEKYC